MGRDKAVGEEKGKRFLLVFGKGGRREGHLVKSVRGGRGNEALSRSTEINRSQRAHAGGAFLTGGRKKGGGLSLKRGER